MAPTTSQATDSPADHKVADYEFGKMNRFHKLAVDLDRAYACCRLTGFERMALQYIRENTWGISAVRKCEPVPCEVSATDLASLLGSYRQQISKAIIDLVKDGLLIRVGDGYLIGKDARTWAKGRIKSSGLAYAIHGDAGARNEIVAKPASKSLRPRTEIVAQPHRNDCGVRTEIVAPYAMKSMQSEPAPYRNAPGIKIPEISGDQKSTQEGARDQVSSGRPEADSFGGARPGGLRTQSQAPVAIPARKVTGPGSDSPEATRLESWAREVGGAGLAFFAKQQCSEVPPEWIEALIRRKVIGQPSMSDRRMLALLSSILASWISAGECEYLKHQSRRSGMGPARLSDPDWVSKFDATMAKIAARSSSTPKGVANA